MMSKQWAKLDMDPEQIPDLRKRQAEDIVIATERLRAEAESTEKIVLVVRGVLLAALEKGHFFPPGFDFTNYINTVSATIMDEMRRNSDALAKYQNMDVLAALVQ